MSHTKLNLWKFKRESKHLQTIIKTKLDDNSVGRGFGGKINQISYHHMDTEKSVKLGKISLMQVNSLKTHKEKLAESKKSPTINPDNR